MSINVNICHPAGCGSASRGRALRLHNITPCFSSEDVWRGPCASTDRDRRLRLLQALVRFRRRRDHDGDRHFSETFTAPSRQARTATHQTRAPNQYRTRDMILRPKPAAKPEDSPRATPTAKARSAAAPQPIFNQGLPSWRDGAQEPAPSFERSPRAGRDCVRNIQDHRRWLSSRPATRRSRPEAGPAAKCVRPAPQPRARKSRPMPSA